MTWNDFVEINHNGLDCVGILDQHQYVFVHRVQSGMVCLFHEISKEACEHYDEWKDNKDYITSILSLPILYKGYWGMSEFKKIANKNG